MSWLGGLAALVTGLALLGIIVPLTRRQTGLPRSHATLGDEQMLALRQLRDLERDHQRGALRDDEYAELRAKGELQAVGLLEKTGVVHPPRARSKLKRKPSAKAPPTRSRTLQAAVVVGLTMAALAAAVPALLNGSASRMAGGFITGQQPAPVIKNSSTTLPQYVAAHPDDVNARLELAQVELEAGQPAQAMAQYLEVLKRQVDNSEAGTRVGLLLYEAGDNENALKAEDKVLTRDPKYPEALFVKGVILLNGLNRPADAIAALQAYLDVTPFGGYRSDAIQLLQQAKAQAHG